MSRGTAIIIKKLKHGSFANYFLMQFPIHQCNYDAFRASEKDDEEEERFRSSISAGLWEEDNNYFFATST